MYTVYAIYNKYSGKIYIGQTEDLGVRIKMHNDHKFNKSFTSRFSGEWVVIYREQATSRSEALVREKQLKSYRGREFVRKHIPR